MNEAEKRNDVKIISITNHSFVNNSSNKVIQIIGLGTDEKLYKRDQNSKRWVECNI